MGVTHSAIDGISRSVCIGMSQPRVARTTMDGIPLSKRLTMRRLTSTRLKQGDKEGSVSGGGKPVKFVVG